MKTFLKKFLVLTAVILAVFTVTNLKPSGTASAACNNFMGLESWDCNIDPSWNGEATLKSNIVNIALNVLQDITVLAAYLVVGFVVYGGYQYILASGDPNKLAAGKKTLLHAFIGLAIVLLSTVIMNAIRIALVGGDGAITDCINTECVKPAELFTNTINWVIGICGLVAAIFVVIGGISYATSAGDPTKLTKAKNTIIYALIGIVIVALSFVITAFVTNLINSSNRLPDQNEDGSFGIIINKEI